MADPFLEDQFASPPRRESVGVDDDAGSYAAHRRRRTNSRHSRQMSLDAPPTAPPPLPKMSFPKTQADDAQPLDGGEEYLPPMMGPSSRRRQRYDSVESFGSSVMPAALPYSGAGAGVNGGHRHAGKARSNGRGQRQHRLELPPENAPGADLLSPTSGAGLEAWLRSQHGSAAPGAEASSSSSPAFASFAPQGRVRRMGSEAGSATGEGSVGAWSQGTTSRRKYKTADRVRSTSRAPLPGVHEGADDGTDNLLRWRSSSAIPSHADHDQRTTDSALIKKSPSGLPPSIAAAAAAPPPGTGHAAAPTPLRALVRGLMKENVPASSIVVIGLGLNAFAQWLIAAGSKGSGGWETLRHWMSLTTHVPADEWYTYDLDHRLLDRPPLAAWWAYAAGSISSSYPALESTLRFPPRPIAKGIPSLLPALGLLAEGLFYAGPVLFFLHRRLADRGRRTRAIAILTILSQPAFTLAAFGLGGLESLWLGMATLAMAFWLTSLPNPGSVTPGAQGQAAMQRITNLSRRVSYSYVAGFTTFLWAVGLDQACLAFAPAAAALLLGRWYGLTRVGGIARGATLVVGISIVAMVTYLVLFWPWIDLRSAESTQRVLARLLDDAWLWSSTSSTTSRSSHLARAHEQTFYGFLGQALDLSASQLRQVALAVTALSCLYPFAILFRAARQTVQIEMLLYEDTTLASRSASRPGQRQVSDGAVSIGGSQKQQQQRQREPSRSSHRASSVAPSDAGSDLRSFAESMIKGGSSSVIDIASQAQRVDPTAPTIKVASSCPSPAAAVLPHGFLAISLAVYLFGPPTATGLDDGESLTTAASATAATTALKVLHPLLPLTLLMVVKGDEWGGGANKGDWQWAALGNNAAVLSLWPLVRRQGLGLPGLVLVLVWNWLVGHRPFSMSGEGPSGGLTTTISRLAHGAMLVAQVVSLIVGGFSGESSPQLVWTLINVVTTPVWLAVYAWSLMRISEVAIGNGIEVGLGFGRGPATKRQKTR